MRVLAVGAHPADVEGGCGGALLAHRDRGDEIHLLVMAGGGAAGADSSRRIAEQEVAASHLGAYLHWGGFEDGAVPAGRDAVAAVESVLVAGGCEVVYCPATLDTHQDRRATSEAALAASRRSLQVLCYETATTLHFDPVLYVDLEGRIGAKLELLSAHRSLIEAGAFVEMSAVAAQARYRGAHARVGHAEGYESHRFVWEITPANLRTTDAQGSWGARSMVSHWRSNRRTSGEVA